MEPSIDSLAMTKRRKQVLRAPATSSEPVCHGWEWAHASLWNEGNKCGVRMADTIILDHNADSGHIDSYLWLFTGKSGAISRKRMSKDGLLPVAKIRERFLQISGRSSDKSVDSVAVVNFLDGTRKVVGIDEFEEILHALDGKRGVSSYGKKVEGLQPYIPSSDESHIQVEFEISRDGSVVRLANSQILWLTHISHVELQQNSEKAVGTSLQKTSSLPNLQSTVTAKGESVVKCRGEFCQNSLASLPGLARLVTMLRNQNDNNLDDDLDQAVLDDNGQRFKMGNNNLLLAHAELDFLKEMLLFRWQEADNVFRMELGRSNPTQFYKQVPVCSNCHRVYSEINKVRDTGFQGIRDLQKAINSSISDLDQTLVEPKANELEGDEQESKDPYDQMFLEELAKQSAAIDLKPEDNKKNRASNGPELEDTERPSSAQAAQESAPFCLLFNTPLSEGRSNQQSTAILRPQAFSDGQLAERVQNLEAELSQIKQKLTGLKHESRNWNRKFYKPERNVRRCYVKKMIKHESSYWNWSTVSTRNRVNSADEISRLIETIDALNLQLDQANRDKEQVKKQLVQSQQAELKKLHQKYQLDIETLRLSEHSAKEQVESLKMKMLSLQSHAQVATTQAKNAKASLDDLTKNKVLVLDEKNQRLERQLAALKLQQRNQGLASGAVTLVASSSIAKQDVEAMEKHLNNKIEYLKAQLSSEMKCKEELGTHLAQITNAMEQMKQIGDVAGKCYGSGPRATMWKSREANAKLAMEKMVEENVRLTRQLVDAEGQVEALQEERKQDAAKVGTMSVTNASEETKRVQMEALLRRLDNERQYLKSQLEDQQEMKEKSQKQVTDLQYEVQELKDTMGDALRASEQKISTLMTETRNQEQELRGTIECLEEGKMLLTRQLKEVQIKFAEAREQSLLERDEIDKSRIEVSEMRTQLLAAKDDNVKEQVYAKRASERMSKSLSAVKNSLKAMEDEKNMLIQRLEEENALYMGKLATAQGEMLVLEEKREKEKIRAKKEKNSAIFALVLGEKIALWKLRVQHCAFTHMNLRANSMRLQVNQDQQRTEELGRLEERLRDDYMAKCDEMTQTLHNERLEAIRRMKEEHDKDREELNEFYVQEKSQLQEDLTAIHTGQMQQMKEKFDSLSKSLETDTQNTIQDLQTENDKLQQGNTRLSEELTEMTQKCEVMATTFEDELAALKTDWESRQEGWSTDQQALQAAIQAQREQFEEKLSSERRKFDLDHQHELEKLQKRHEDDTSELSKESAAQLAMLCEEYSQRYAEFHATEMSVMEIKYHNEMEREINAVAQRWQKELDSLHEKHEKAYQDAVLQAELKANKQLESMQKEMNERKGTAVVKCTSKWQRAMEELQERQEVEKNMTYNQGLQDREKEWQQAALQIKERQREELGKVQQEAVAAIRAAEEQLKSQLEEQHSQALQNLSDEITTRERERAQEHMDASAQVLEQELTAKWTEQLQEQQLELESKFSAEKSRLTAIFVDEKEAALQELRQVHEEQRVQLDQVWSEKLENLAANTAICHEKQLDSLNGEHDREKENLANQLQSQYSKQLEERLRDQEARLLREQEDAIAQVQEDSEKLIEQVERAMTELKKQKEHLETELGSLRSASKKPKTLNSTLRKASKSSRNKLRSTFYTSL
ncbi:hypothetical protein GQ600_26299 [Phytophthora cactorum]|nr:hypothetical protein GQ600_26299 [Phytophthora cactorum]